VKPRIAILAILAMIGCDTRNATWTAAPSPTSGELVVQSWNLVSMSGVKAKFRRCSVLRSTYDIGDASEEREVAIEPWVYDLLFPAECEVRLLVDAPNLKIVPVRGGER
jgi:hypothetical protein